MRRNAIPGTSFPAFQSKAVDVEYKVVTWLFDEKKLSFSAMSEIPAEIALVLRNLNLPPLTIPFP